MRHTLLPLMERVTLRREYRVRTLIVLLSTLSAALFVGAAALFPAYLHTWSLSRTALDQVATINNDSAKDNLTNVQKSLASDEALLTALGGGVEAPKFSSLVSAIVALHSPLSISSMNMDRQGASSIAVSMSGVAPTRDELLQFKDRLMPLTANGAINLPIEELAKSVNVPFSIQFIANLP